MRPLTVGDQVVMRRAPQIRGEVDGPVPEDQIRGTVVRVIDPGRGYSAGARLARVRWSNGCESKVSLGMLRPIGGTP